MTGFPALPVTWSLDGLQFNSGDDENGVSRIVNVSGWDGSPAGRPALTSRVSGHGSYRGPNYRASRVVELQGWSTMASPDMRSAEAARLAELCYGPDDLFPLTQLDGSQSLTLWVELNDKVDVQRLRDGVTLALSVQLVATDPNKYGSAHPPQSTSLPVGATGGIAWNGTTTASGGTGTEWNDVGAVATGLVYQTAGGTSGTVTLWNDGSADAPIDFAIEVSAGGSAVNPAMTRLDTGQQIIYGGTVAAGSVLRTNTGTEIVTLDGADRSGLLLRDQFFLVPAGGSIDVLFTADAGSSNALLTATNADVYI